MTLDEQLVSGAPEPRRAVPQISDAPAFGADCLLLGAFLIALGTPIAHTIGIPHSLPTALTYVAGVVLLVGLLPFEVWVLHWGRPVPRRVRRIALTAVAYQLPVLVVAILAVAFGMQRVLLGVSIMSFAAAVLIALAGERFREYPAPTRLLVVRSVATFVTPIMVIAFTQILPHGADVMVDWAIPVPVAGACAVGAAQGFKRQMLLRDRISPHAEE